jgi:hypothetical protein
MKANLKNVQQMLETKKRISNLIDDLEWSIAQGLCTREEGIEEIEKNQAVLDKLVNNATKDDLFVLLTGRFYTGDDNDIYYRDKPSTEIPTIIGA